jgi:predicted DCC family thiol-disulfide oxidoreductase YuxK
MDKHLVFYDGDCPLCHRAVRHILSIDPHKRFYFAPLNGKTASEVLSGPNKEYSRMNSLVFVENYQSTEREFWIRSRAILRIYWLVGGQWALFGWLSFFPCWVGDFFYRWLAFHRHQFKLKPIQDLGHKEQFLL